MIAFWLTVTEAETWNMTVMNIKLLEAAHHKWQH